jgi:hypothetical protein
MHGGAAFLLRLLAVLLAVSFILPVAQGAFDPAVVAAQEARWENSLRQAYDSRATHKKDLCVVWLENPRGVEEKALFLAIHDIYLYYVDANIR